MKKLHFLIFSISSMLLSSCERPYADISGYWEVTYPDTVSYTRQVLHFYVKGGKLELAIDEPLDGTLGIPGERVMLVGDSIHFESMWGLFHYDLSFVPGDSLIHGTRLVNNSFPVSFVMKKAAEPKLSYRIPRVDADGDRILKYSYVEPLQRADGLSCSSLEKEGVNSEPVQRLVEDILSGKMSTIHSLLLLKDNKLVLEEYFHNYDENTLHRLESVSKSFTSALMGIAIDKGLVPGVDEPVSSYLQQWDSTRWVREGYNIRIKHLLTMTSGLEWKGFTANERNDDVDIYLSPDYIKYILDKKLVNVPGENFYYNNRLMYLQGQIIEESSGLSVDSFAAKYLFDELGIERHHWSRYDNGIYETGGGLKLRPRDMMKFGMLYLNQGKWKEKQILSADWVLASSSQHTFTGNMGYGYNWWIKSYHSGNKTLEVFMAMGHGEQTIMVIPEMNTVFVMTAGNFFQKPQRLDQIMNEYIIPALAGKEEIQPGSFSVKAENIVGEYEINQDESILIELKNGILYAIDPTGEWMKLVEKESGHYAVKDTPREVRVVLDEEGKAIAAEVIVNGEVVERLNKIK